MREIVLVRPSTRVDAVRVEVVLREIERAPAEGRREALENIGVCSVGGAGGLGTANGAADQLRVGEHSGRGDAAGDRAGGDDGR